MIEELIGSIVSFVDQWKVSERGMISAQTYSSMPSAKRSSPSPSSSSFSRSLTASRSSTLSSVSENGAKGDEGGKEDEDSRL